MSEDAPLCSCSEWRYRALEQFQHANESENMQYYKLRRTENMNMDTKNRQTTQIKEAIMIYWFQEIMKPSASFSMEMKEEDERKEHQREKKIKK